METDATRKDSGKGADNKKFIYSLIPSFGNLYCYLVLSNDKKLVQINANRTSKGCVIITAVYRT